MGKILDYSTFLITAVSAVTSLITIVGIIFGVVKFYKKNKMHKKFKKVKDAILAGLMTPQEISDETKLSIQEVRSFMSDLHDQGAIVNLTGGSQGIFECTIVDREKMLR